MTRGRRTSRAGLGTYRSPILRDLPPSRTTARAAHLLGHRIAQRSGRWSEPSPCLREWGRNGRRGAETSCAVPVGGRCAPSPPRCRETVGLGFGLFRGRRSPSPGPSSPRGEAICSRPKPHPRSESRPHAVDTSGPKILAIVPCDASNYIGALSVSISARGRRTSLHPVLDTMPRSHPHGGRQRGHGELERHHSSRTARRCKDRPHGQRRVFRYSPLRPRCPDPLVDVFSSSSRHEFARPSRHVDRVPALAKARILARPIIGRRTSNAPGSGGLQIGDRPLPLRVHSSAVSAARHRQPVHPVELQARDESSRRAL